MLAMTQLHDIRRLYFEEGRNVSEIAKTTGCDRKTVRGTATIRSFWGHFNQPNNFTYL